ncbi:MAG: alanine racemase [Deltaproteobacteria bacterium]|nr:alanine racemase [Deltaproteobacteria bacterium]
MSTPKPAAPVDSSPGFGASDGSSPGLLDRPSSPALGDGARVVRPRRAAPAEAARVTRAEINLAHLRHNLHELRACVASAAAEAGRAPARIWAVIKADAYGHGGSVAATTLEKAGVDGVCVALLEEGIELRNAGFRGPILVMSGSHGRRRDGLEALIEHRLTPVVFDAEQIDALANAQRYMVSTGASEGALEVHVKIDTGMGRLGVRPESLGAVLGSLRACPELRVAGWMTHLACADVADDGVTPEQLQRFEAALATVATEGFDVSLRHAANSAALLRWPSSHFEVVRPGLALFGVHPGPASSPASDEAPVSVARTPKFKPAMSILTEVIALRDLPEGGSLGYGHTWTASRPSRIATIPIGYADGLSRSLSNRGAMLIGGKRVPIVGTVSMDLTMVDVTDLPQVAVRDEVVVMGEQRGRFGTDAIGAQEIAELSGTISWETLTSVSRRVPRFYRHP